MFEKLKGLFSGDDGQIIITAPVAGEAVPVGQVNDPTFSEDILGKGVAIKPAANRVVAPAGGTLTQMFETGHACSVVTDSGAELLIHVGLDTIKLKGTHYTIRAHDNDKVQAGDVLMEFDREAIAADGYDTITPVVLLNPGQFAKVEMKTGPVAEGDPLMVLTKK